MSATCFEEMDLEMELKSEMTPMMLMEMVEIKTASSKLVGSVHLSTHQYVILFEETVEYWIEKSEMMEMLMMEMVEVVYE